MEITKSKINDIVIFSLKGRMDTTTAPQMQDQLLVAIGSGEKRLAIDCAQLEYISSAGLRALLMAAKQLKNVNGKIVLYSLKAHIREVFDLAGFSAAFPLFNSQADALASFKS